MESDSASTRHAGDAPANLRNAFLELIDGDTPADAANPLLARLAGCTDMLPLEYCQMLDLPQGTTFGQAAQRVRHGSTT